MYSVAIYFKEVASYNPEINDLRYVNFVLITYWQIKFKFESNKTQKA